MIALQEAGYVIAIPSVRTPVTTSSSMVEMS